MVSSTIQSNATPKVIDLFCGCGGFSLGAARAGFDVVAGIDFDKNAIASHAANFPNSIHLNWDLSQAEAMQLIEQINCPRSEITGIIGGPPCQGFSSMGSSRKDDPRNRLFLKFFKIVNDIRPKFFICENVPGILRSRYDSVREEAFALVESDYNVLGPIKIKASDFGAPTTRTRAFFFGIRNDLKSNLKVDDFQPPANPIQLSVERALLGLPTKINENWQDEDQGWRKVIYKFKDEFDRHLLGRIPEGIGDPESIRLLQCESRVSGCLGTVHQSGVIDRFSMTAPGTTERISRAPRLEPSGLCPTLRAGTGSDRGSYQAVRPIHPSQPRVITPREAARLQGFPDWFRFAPSKWHSFRQIGNSVSPILAEQILRKIYETIN